MTRWLKRCGPAKWRRWSGRAIALAATGRGPAFCSGATLSSSPGAEEYARRFSELLNYGTVPFYRAWDREGRRGVRTTAQVDAILEKMAGTQILPKGHPLVWFHQAGIPEFLKKKSWAGTASELPRLHPAQRRPLPHAHTRLGRDQRSARLGQRLEPGGGATGRNHAPGGGGDARRGPDRFPRSQQLLHLGGICGRGAGATAGALGRRSARRSNTCRQ